MSDLASLTKAVGRQITAGLTGVDEAAAIKTYRVLWDALQDQRREEDLTAVAAAVGVLR